MKNPCEKKPCKLCSNKRFANLTICYQHHREKEKAKKLERAEKKKLRKESSKKFIESQRKMLHKKAWALISEIIRRHGVNLDGYGECYTCGKMIHWREANAGHFKHDRLDFDPRNLKRQCVTCNKYYSGRLDVYASRLIEDYGLEWFRQLERDSHAYNKYDVERLKTIIEDLEKILIKIINDPHATLDFRHGNLRAS